ncbi:hypothetical protein H671_xg20593 [Cricetulus griseus]|uniref:Uncharacterized protein n=1 Tax=Cricetulus griseus TaxID=10029 RepID=A0A061HXF2_CRIGR|nr:hypothetical protein H671_xg20593 [Cricetulus griseus]
MLGPQALISHEEFGIMPATLKQYLRWISEHILNDTNGSHLRKAMTEYANGYEEMEEERTSQKDWGMMSNGYRKGKMWMESHYRKEQRQKKDPEDEPVDPEAK